jgi:polyferredoxin
MIIFFILIARGRAQLWIIIFGIGLLISLIWGRFYCGWVCPINTVIKIKNWFYEKLGIDTMQTPSIFKKEIMRWILLILMLGSMIIMRKNNLQLNIFLYILGMAFLISLFIEEELWHKYLCPYGALLSLTNKANSKKLVIDNKHCKSCGLCAESCPNNIISISKEKQTISKRECLYCFKCQDVCEFKAISYLGK